jgi:hypothetical protein
MQLSFQILLLPAHPEEKSAQGGKKASTTKENGHSMELVENRPF